MVARDARRRRRATGSRWAALIFTWLSSAAAHAVGRRRSKPRNARQRERSRGGARSRRVDSADGARRRVDHRRRGAARWLARARGPKTIAPSVALNCDSVDDEGPLVAMYSRVATRRADRAPGGGRRGASRREPPRVLRLIPGILTDSVALADAGWETVTLSRGTIRTLQRIHTSRDTLSSMRGDRHCRGRSGPGAHGNGAWLNAGSPSRSRGVARSRDDPLRVPGDARDLRGRAVLLPARAGRRDRA